MSLDIKRTCLYNGAGNFVLTTTAPMTFMFIFDRIVFALQLHLA
jgi:hypothetical protein